MNSVMLLGREPKNWIVYGGYLMVLLVEHDILETCFVCLVSDAVLQHECHAQVTIAKIDWINSINIVLLAQIMFTMNG